MAIAGILINHCGDQLLCNCHYRRSPGSVDSDGAKIWARGYEFHPQNTFLFSIFLGGIFLVLAGDGMFQTTPFLRLLHTTTDTISLAKDYLQIIFAGISFLAVYNVYSAVLRGIGDSTVPFYSVLLASVMNVVLDIVFVAFFHWSVAEAAIGTVVSQAAMTFFLIGYRIKKYDFLRVRLCRAVFS